MRQSRLAWVACGWFNLLAGGAGACLAALGVLVGLVLAVVPNFAVVLAAAALLGMPACFALSGLCLLARPAARRAALAYLAVAAGLGLGWLISVAYLEGPGEVRPLAAHVLFPAVVVTAGVAEMACLWSGLRRG